MILRFSLPGPQAAHVSSTAEYRALYLAGIVSMIGMDRQRATYAIFGMGLFARALLQS